MKEYDLINNKEIFEDKIYCECENLDEDYDELLDTMELEAAERAEIKELEDSENKDAFFEDVDEISIKTAEDWYFTYVLNKQDVLQTEEQLRLLKIYHTSNNEREKDEARDLLLAANQRLVVSIAKKHKISGVSLDDLIQEGNIGLMKAIDKYDISTNYALSTYATHWIRQAIGRYIQEQGSAIRIPVNMLEKIYKFRRIISEYQRKGAKIPSHIELAKLTGCNSNQLTRVIYYSNIMETVSISSPLKGRKDGFGEGIELQDSIPSIADTPADEYENSDAVKALHEEMRKMFDSRTYDILCRRYGINEYLVPQKLEEIGRVYGISKERVRQIQDKAEKQLFRSKSIKALIR